MLLRNEIDVPLNIPMYASNACFQCLHRPVHPLELLCMGEASNLKPHSWGFAIVVPLKLNGVIISQLDQMLAAPLQQTTIRRMSGRLRHDRRIDDQPVKTG